MKKIIAIAFVLGLVVACKPEIKPIGTSYKAGAGIPGTWEMNKLEMTDITVPVPETRDLSILLENPSNKLIITIAGDGTYTVDEPGFGPQVLGTGGAWATDTVDFPTMIAWYSNEGDTLMTDLTNMPRTIDNTFGFEFTRNRCDTDYLTYSYSFNRK